jgi:hypothetical protein
MQTSSQYPRFVTPVRLVKHLKRGAQRLRNGFNWNSVSSSSTRVQLNNQGFVDIGTKLVAIGHGLEGSLCLVDADLNPSGHANLLR